MKRFDNKTVLVTGGNSGIGLAAARQYASEGARVIITGRDQATLDSARESLGGRTLALQSDQGNIGDSRRLAALLAEQGVTLDAIFINAGMAKFAPFEDIDGSPVGRTFDVNVKGAYFLIQALAAAAQPRRGHRPQRLDQRPHRHAELVRVRGQQGRPDLAGQDAVGRTAAQGVRVNVVSPGPVTTPLYGTLGLEAEQLTRWPPPSRARCPRNASARPMRWPAPCSIWRRRSRPSSWARN